VSLRRRSGPPRSAHRAKADPFQEETSVSLEFISSAYAQGSAPGGSDLMTFLPMIAIFVVFYFLLIRPQQKKAKEARRCSRRCKKANEVVTAGGLLGRSPS
jgi:hypothetical protein